MSTDNHCLRVGRSFLSVTLLPALLLLMVCLPEISLSKELPMLVELAEIGESFDGHRVTTFGWVRSAEVKTGRRGSLHLALIVGEGTHKILVFSVRPVHNMLNQEVIVQGIYHEHGRFAGFEQNRFIVADAIVRNWQGRDTENKQQKEHEKKQKETHEKKKEEKP